MKNSNILEKVEYIKIDETILNNYISSYEAGKKINLNKYLKEQVLDAKVKNAEGEEILVTPATKVIADFSGLVIKGAGSDNLKLFHNVDLSGVKLGNVKFVNCDLSKVNLRETDFTNVIFSGNVKLNEADLRGVIFSQELKLEPFTWMMMDYTKISAESVKLSVGDPRIILENYSDKPIIPKNLPFNTDKPWQQDPIYRIGSNNEEANKKRILVPASKNDLIEFSKLANEEVAEKIIKKVMVTKKGKTVTEFRAYQKDQEFPIINHEEKIEFIQDIRVRISEPNLPLDQQTVPHLSFNEYIRVKAASKNNLEIEQKKALLDPNTVCIADFYQQDLSGIQIKDLDLSYTNMCQVKLGESIETQYNRGKDKLEKKQTRIENCWFTGSNFESAKWEDLTIINSRFDHIRAPYLEVRRVAYIGDYNSNEYTIELLKLEEAERQIERLESLMNSNDDLELSFVNGTMGDNSEIVNKQKDLIVDIAKFNEEIKLKTEIENLNKEYRTKKLNKVDFQSDLDSLLEKRKQLGNLEHEYKKEEVRLKILKEYKITEDKAENSIIIRNLIEEQKEQSKIAKDILQKETREILSIDNKLGLEFFQADFSHATFDQTATMHTKYVGCNLEGVTIENSNLDYTNLKQTNCEDLNVLNSSIRGLHALETNLNNAILTNVNAKKAKLEKIQADGMKILKSNINHSIFEEIESKKLEIIDSIAKDLNMKSGNIDELITKKLEAKNLELKEIKIKKWKDEWSKLENAILSELEIDEVDFLGTDLAKMQGISTAFKNGMLKKCNMELANLREAVFAGLKMPDINLEGADLENANFNNADMREAILKKANIKNANFEDANLNKADIREAIGQEEANIAGTNLAKAKVDAEGQFAKAKDEQNRWYNFFGMESFGLKSPKWLQTFGRQTTEKFNNMVNAIPNLISDLKASAIGACSGTAMGVLLAVGISWLFPPAGIVVTSSIVLAGLLIGSAAIGATIGGVINAKIRDIKSNKKLEEKDVKSDLNETKKEQELATDVSKIKVQPDMSLLDVRHTGDEPKGAAVKPSSLPESTLKDKPQIKKIN
ncbi:MAG: pentapeptide repeat-containing protein [Alphaproteobacteria bacterium]